MAWKSWSFSRLNWSTDTQIVNIIKLSKLPGGNETIIFMLYLTMQKGRARFTSDMFVLSHSTKKWTFFNQQVTVYKRLFGFLDILIGCVAVKVYIYIMIIFAGLRLKKAVFEILSTPASNTCSEFIVEKYFGLILFSPANMRTLQPGFACMILHGVA